MTARSLVPVCPQHGNNLCFLYPRIFAEKHFEGADAEYYKWFKETQEKFVDLRMREYMKSHDLDATGI